MREKKTGIYKIINLETHMFYIGSAIDLSHRENQHFSDLKLNRHRNIHLQRSYNIHGKNNFEFIVLEECLKENLIEREQYYIDLYVKHSALYNISLKAGSNLGRRLRDDTKKKISLANMGEKSPRTHLNWDDVENIRKNYFNGFKLKELAKQYDVSDSCIQHIVWNLNWHDPDYNPPQNHFGRSGERNGGAKLSKELIFEIRKRYREGGIFQKDLAKEYGVSRMTILRIVNYHHWKNI